MSKYVPPVIRRGDSVVFSGTLSGIENQDKSHVGLVDKVYPDGVCNIIVLFPGGNRGMECCRHFDDPYIESHPDFIKEIDTGVYKLSESVVQQRLTYDKLVAGEQRAAERLSLATDSVATDAPEDPTKRKRGRPRKEDK